MTIDRDVTTSHYDIPQGNNSQFEPDVDRTIQYYEPLQVSKWCYFNMVSGEATTLYDTIDYMMNLIIEIPKTNSRVLSKEDARKLKTVVMETNVEYPQRAYPVTTD